MRIPSFTILASLSLALASPAAAQATRSTQVGSMDTYQLRAVGGELEGRGYLWIEAYQAHALETIWHVTQVTLGEAEHPIEALHGIVLGEAREEGFAFTAMLGSEPVACTALTWADMSAVCSLAREPAPVPRTSCEAAFLSAGGRRQCATTYGLMQSRGQNAEGMLQACAGAFRSESQRTKCYLAAQDPIWVEAFPACIAAYDGADERDLCLFSTINTVGRDRIDVAIVRQCTGSGDDLATTRCMWSEHVRRLQRAEGMPVNPGAPIQAQPPPERARPLVDALVSPTGGPTQITSRRAAMRENIATVYGGMIEGEPVLFFSLMQPTWPDRVDREGMTWLRVGRTVRAFREVTSVEVVSMRSEVLTFRVTLDGRERLCRVEIGGCDAVC